MTPAELMAMMNQNSSNQSSNQSFDFLDQLDQALAREMREKEKKKTIFILEKSYKNGAFCIAGKDMYSGEWIRIVSTSQGGPITNLQSLGRYYHGSTKMYPVQCLNVVEVDFIGNFPYGHQRENYLISGERWEYCPSHSIEDIERRCEPFDQDWILDHPSTLWINKPTNYTNRVSSEEFFEGDTKSSIYFVEVNDVRLYTTEYNGKIRRRVNFTYNGIRYRDLACTDPKFDEYMNNIENYIDKYCGISKQDGEVYSERAYIVVSLGEEYYGHYYKLVAAIYFIPIVKDYFDPNYQEPYYNDNSLRILEDYGSYDNYVAANTFDGVFIGESDLD